MKSVENNEFVDIKGIYKRYIKYWPVFVVSVFVLGILGVIYLKVVPPVLQVNANILIKEDKGISGTSASAAAASEMMQSFAFGGSSAMGGVSVNDELFLLSSYSIFRDLSKNLGLNVQYLLSDFPRTKDCYKSSPISVYTVNPLADTLRAVINFDVNLSKNGVCKIKAKNGWKKLGSVETKEFPVKLNTALGTFYFDTTKYYVPKKTTSLEINYMGHNLCAEILQKQVTVDLYSKKANVISLVMEEVNPKRGTDILNTLVNFYNKNGEVDKNDETKLMDEFLTERISLMEAELDSVEREIELYKKANNLTDIETEAKIILEKSQDFKERQIEAESQYTVIQLVEEFLTKDENRYSLVPLNIGLSDRTVLEGLQTYNEALLERIKLMMTTKPGNPAIDLVNKQIDAMRANMLETVRSIKSGFSRSRNELQSQENYFLSRIANMPQQEREFITMKRQQMIKQELFLFLLQKREENALTQALVKPRAKIVDPAYVLSEPVSPKLSVVLVVVTMLSVLVSMLYIVIVELLRKRKKV